MCVRKMPVRLKTDGAGRVHSYKVVNSTLHKMAVGAAS